MKNILLTGDDGYNSLGTRVLISLLKKDFNITVSGTKKQQSGVGGFKSLQSEGEWGETTVDGIQAFWIEGTPIDSMELVKEVSPKPFDYIISGINWGANIGGCLLSSGTFSAAVHGINLGISKMAIAVSWDTPAKYHFRNHSIQDDFSSYLLHPGKNAYESIIKTMTHKNWGADIININIPQQSTEVIEFVRPLKNIYTLWPIMHIDKRAKRFSYAISDRSTNLGEKDTDVQALARGHMTISPCQSIPLNTEIYRKMKK